MKLVVDDLGLPDGTRVTVRLGEGDWATARVPRPELFLDAVAGLASATGDVVLDAVPLGRADHTERWEAGLITAPCVLDDLPGLTVLDVVLLGRRRQDRVSLWAAALGTRRARSVLADAEAAARSLSGRLGLSPRLGDEAVGLGPRSAALVDTARALSAAPSALVWRCPEWLDDGDVAALKRLVADEQRRLRFAVLEVVAQ